MRNSLAAVIILLLLMNFPLMGQRGRSAALVEEIRQESFDLALLEEEIAYYQNLLQRKEEVDQLYSQKKLGAIREMFEEDLASLDVLFAQNALDKATEKYWEIERIYMNIEALDITSYFPEYKLQYYQARIAVRTGDYETARRILELNLANNLDPDNRNAIVYLLEEVYFELERYADIISIYPIYRGINSVEQRWWLGQSLYNTDDLEKALPVFRRLVNEPDFALRARQMLALITYRQGDIAQAITEFNTLKFSYSPETPYFNFINLSLARLQALSGNQQEAINLYDQYIQLEKEVDDEFLYEIASLYRESKEYNQAIRYFRMITEKPRKSRYFVTAKYLIAITEQDRGNYESGRESLRTIIDNNNEMMQALNQKYGMLEEYSRMMSGFGNAPLSGDQQVQMEQRLAAMEERFVQNRREIERLSQGIESDNLSYLVLLEEEYFAHTLTQVNYEAFIKFSGSDVLRRLPPLSNYEMTRQDSSIVYLQILDYMEKISDKSSRNYENARFMAEQKVYQAFLRESWYDISSLIQKYDSPEVLKVTAGADSLIARNLELLAQMEKEAFLKNSSVESEKNEIKDNNKNLEKREKDFITGFARYITPLLSEELEVFASAQSEIRFKYVETITTLLEDLSDENNMYQNTLLDILFRQTMLLDQEYSDFREKIANE